MSDWAGISRFTAVVRRALPISLLIFLPRVAFAADRASDTEVIVVGAGISGLSAALEAARAGATVKVIDMASVFGGHAVMSEGGVSIVDSPMHRERGFHDSAKLAYQDFISWGEDVNEEWTKFYVENSRTEVFQWLRAIGVEFAGIRVTPGNSVPRFHEAIGRGLGLVAPIYRECLRLPNITFVWNTEVTKLHVSNGRVIGIGARNVRSGSRSDLYGSAVVLATGGFQSRLELVREHWPKTFPFPTRLLLGSGANSQGSGLGLATQAGAAVAHLDYQWNYPFGLPDPRDPSGQRGMNSRNTGALWVNAEGRRFVNEIVSPKVSLPEVLRQPGGTYWAIFDEPTKRFLWISGTDWQEFATIERLILSNPNLVKSASTLDELAVAIGVPSKPLNESVARYNDLVSAGDDTDFGRFGPSDAKYAGQRVQILTPPRRIETPPFYAVQYFPLTRKNNGGVKVDLSCRVATATGGVVPGLYAVGELTGSGGMNGKAGLEGVWLGPGILMGRVAGKAAAKEPRATTRGPVGSNFVSAAPMISEGKTCVECHKMPELVKTARPGFWHFQNVHRVVQQRSQNCLECHSDMLPSVGTRHEVNPIVRAASCASCHGGK